ncbi:MAG: CvpA family protein [Syntrophobacteraceae bacterium]|nr:CvpA family protein [Syntrophobacteraceae bacterium]
MNVLDWILICTAGFWVLRGFMRGAVSQLFGVAGILAGFLVASYQYIPVSFLLIKQFSSLVTVARPVSFVLLFVLTWFCVAVAGFWVAKILRTVGLGFVDRLWGAMIGFTKALLFAIIAFSILTLFSFGGDSTLIAGSKLAPSIKGASRVLFELAPANVQGELSSKQKDLKEMVSQRTSGLVGSLVGSRAGSKEKGGNSKN